MCLCVPIVATGWLEHVDVGVLEGRHEAFEVECTEALLIWLEGAKDGRWTQKGNSWCESGEA